MLCPRPLPLILDVAQVEGLLKDINAKEPSQGSTEDIEPSDTTSHADVGFNSGGYHPLAPGVAADPFLEADSGSQDGNHQGSQLLGLGMTEALPPFEIIEDL